MGINSRCISLLVVCGSVSSRILSAPVITHPLGLHGSQSLRSGRITTLSCFINIHQTAERQTVFSLIQGADPIGKPLRKHRHHTVCQVNAGAPFQGFSIQCTAALHIIADICNMNPQMINISPLLSEKPHHPDPLHLHRQW